MSVDKYRTVRLRRADVNRIEAELEKLGGMYLTDWGTAVSYMTAGEIFKMAGEGWSPEDDRVSGKRETARGWQMCRFRCPIPRACISAADEDRINEQNTADDADGSDQ